MYSTAMGVEPRLEPMEKLRMEKRRSGYNALSFVVAFRRSHSLGNRSSEADLQRHSWSAPSSQSRVARQIPLTDAARWWNALSPTGRLYPQTMRSSAVTAIKLKMA
jgi:hypothetical protein